jgi:hypothetical protein
MVRAVLLCMMLFCAGMQAQTVTNLDRGILIGNLLFEGYKALKGSPDAPAKADPNAKTVASFCYRNRAAERITVRMSATVEEEEVKKEFVIRKGDKECAYQLPKGVYTYEILLPSKEVYQKGEYRVIEEMLITVQ